MFSVIRAKEVWKEYAEEEGTTVAALRGASMRADAGEVVAIFGKSGSGKSTLLNLLAGLDSPTRGTIEVFGQDLAGLGENGRTEIRRVKLGFVFQFFNLLPTLTAFENVFLSLELTGKPDRDKAMAALASVGLDGKESRYPRDLSGGEQQRVAIARAVVKEPALILADEPTGNLDTSTGDQVLDLLTRACRETSTTLIMVSHSLFTCRYAHRAYRMTDGVMEEVPTEEVVNP